MRAPFYPIRTENKGFILIKNKAWQKQKNTTLTKTSPTKKKKKKKKKKKTSQPFPTSDNAITTGSATVNFNPSPFLSHGGGLSMVSLTKSCRNSIRF
jgi:hypothetical protein